MSDQRQKPSQLLGCDSIGQGLPHIPYTLQSYALTLGLLGNASEAIECGEDLKHLTGSPIITRTRFSVKFFRPKNDKSVPGKDR